MTAPPADGAAGATLLDARRLSAGYGDVRVLWDVELSVREGELVALVGSNGAGKTTLLRVLSGLIQPSSGEIIFRGGPIGGLHADQIVQQRLVHVPEGRCLFPNMSVEQNLMLGAVTRAGRKAIAADLERVYALFPRLAERRRQAAGSMSAPVLLMVDEMSNGLAPLLVDQLMTALLKLREEGLTILLVEQDVQMALESADRGYVLDTGHVALSGRAQEILADPRVRTAYLGL
jgi:branched-chain amino acid transport system ATP-binding protein